LAPQNIDEHHIHKKSKGKIKSKKRSKASKGLELIDQVKVASLNSTDFPLKNQQVSKQEAS
jgi:hypothetical protein